MSTIRILIADDHGIMRTALARYIDQEPDMEVIGEADDGQKVVELTKKLAPDLVLMDAVMPRLGGIEATRRIVEQNHNVRVVALSRYTDQEAVLGMFEAGARGYVHKGSNPRELFEAIRSVAEGEHYMSPVLAGRLMAAYLEQRARGERAEPALSPRQREIVQLLADGHSMTDIARLLELDRRTVDSHRREAMKKLGLRSVASLIKWAVKNHLTESDP